jgi:hypothetical protein
MTREEMVLKIAECLIEPHHDDPIKEASYILKRIEKAGMLPPYRDNGQDPITEDGEANPKFYGYGNTWDKNET